jgi:hypothetical protein
MIESLLEELLLQRETNRNQHIQFVYASSGEVYSHHAAHHGDSPNPPPFSEAKPLTTPSTVAGATKLVDEMLAQAYFDVHGLPSTALRLFNVYGPWGLPGSTLFVMAERATLRQDPAVPDAELNNVADYIYIDDAVDAIMAAMQFQTSNPSAIAINVGTGQGTTLRTIAKLMRSLAGLPPVDEPTDATPPASTISFADMNRASTLLGFSPQVSLVDGLARLLSWHYDRTFPYGSGSSATSLDAQAKKPQGMVAQCDRYDAECLHGTPIFPCASECAHESQCHGSLYDDILDLTRAVTASCRVVLYTVSLHLNVTRLPSAHVRVSTQSIAYVDQNGNDAVGNGVHCNLAFVSNTSPLYTSLKNEESTNSRRYSSTMSDGVIKHGFWSLIPVIVTDLSQPKLPILSLLPKLSPSKFFADTVEHAIYCDPDVIFDNIPRLILESEMQPKHSSVPGSTVMLVGNKPVDATGHQKPLQATVFPTPPRQRVQEDAYRLIRMAVIDEMVGDGLSQKLDAGFIVHNLRRLSEEDDDGRMFRCDVFGEVLQWQVESDVSALEFMLGLHDMWSRVMVKRTGLEPWWIGDGVASVSMQGAPVKRRLKEQQGKAAARNEGKQRNDVTGADDGANANKGDQGREESDDEDDDPKNKLPEDMDNAGIGEHNGFGAIEIDAVSQKNLNGNEQQAPQQRFGDRPSDEEEDNDFVVDDDDAAESHPLRGARGSGATDDTPSKYLPDVADQDPSSYDVWMGVLSSTRVRYFCRIVSMEAVGVYHVAESIAGDTSVA